ncbi:MAG: asparagine synthase-related protein [Solirubrobacteraceae bacterium]
MLRAAWGEGRHEALRRLAERRGLGIVEHGRLAVAADELDHAQAGNVCCVFAGRLVGVAPGGCARHLLDRHARSGLAALGDLDGAYVAFISDGVSAWVTRDRLGARTLCYSSRDGEAFLGEHEADVLELLASTPPPDRLALVQWMERGSLPDGRTLFTGLRRLRAGQLLELTARGSVEHAYWRPAFHEPSRASRSELADALREATFRAVARAREGAAAPGICVSGGLDSACVAAGLAQAGGAPAQALAITFPAEQGVDETPLIEATARFSGLPLRLVPFAGGEVLPPVQRHIERWLVPPPSAMMLIWEDLWPLARSLGIDVMLDGQGGDETFGASRYLIGDRLRAGRLLAAWRLAGSLPGPGAGEGMPWQARMRVLRRIGLPAALPARLQAARRRRLPRERVVGRLVRTQDVAALVAQDDPWAFKYRHDGPLWWGSLVSMFMDNPDAYDANGFFRRVSADTGIERRHPLFHDVGLFERVLATPPESAFDATRDRPLLRDALAGYVSDEVRKLHVKLVFNSVVLSRMAGDEGRRLAAELARSDAPVREYVDTSAIGPLFDPEQSRNRDQRVRAIQLFTVAAINRWLAVLENGPAEPASDGR